MVAGLQLALGNIGPIRKAASFKQPEDSLYYYICNNTYIQKVYNLNHPGSSIPAPEWADVLVCAVNTLYGKNVVYFDGNIYPEKIIADLEMQLPVQVSMQYPENKPKPIAGHYVLVVGLMDGKYLVNDPYKNHLTGAADGYHCEYTRDDLVKHSKGYGIRFKKI